MTSGTAHSLPIFSIILNGSTRREVGRGGCIWDHHFGEVVGGQRWYYSQERLWFPVGSPYGDHCAISNHSAAIYRRISPMLESTEGLGHFETKLWQKRADRCNPNFNAIWKRHGAVLCKRNRVDVFCISSPMHERDRHRFQTGRPRNRFFSDVAY